MTPFLNAFAFGRNLFSPPGIGPESKAESVRKDG